MTYSETMDKVYLLVEELKKDADKFYVKGQNTAGLRIREQMQELRDLCVEVRKEIQTVKKSRPKKREGNPAALEKARAARAN